MINIVNGNLLTFDATIICQQVNCQGVMGSGLAKQIKDKYPIVYKEYLERDSCKGSILGDLDCVEIGNGKYVANIYGQRFYGRQKKVYTSYDALKSGFDSIKKILQYNPNWTVAIPYKIGCDLGGGDWNIVYDMINEIFKDHTDNVTIVRLLK